VYQKNLNTSLYTQHTRRTSKPTFTHGIPEKPQKPACQQEEDRDFTQRATYQRLNTPVTSGKIAVDLPQNEHKELCKLIN